MCTNETDRRQRTVTGRTARDLAVTVRMGILAFAGMSRPEADHANPVRSSTNHSLDTGVTIETVNE